MGNTHPSHFSTHWKLCIWNANGAWKHRNELEVILHENEITVLLLSETHLKPGDWFYIRGYNIWRRNRLEIPGGGVAVCVSSETIGTLN